MVHFTNTNTQDNVYVAVIITHLLQEFSRFHLMNVEQCRVASIPHIKTTDFGQSLPVDYCHLHQPIPIIADTYLSSHRGQKAELT